ncbi:MAG: hypothetical protein LBQ08_04950 [Holosporaceae bacterium]|jgi:trk system potassium uptake protein TrkH|nr:hypothetical protein [Holosporaceae bacterium]
MISYQKIFHIIGVILFILAAAMIIPIIVDLCLMNDTCLCFVISGIFCCFIGGLLFFSNQSNENIILNLREKILVVLFSWISVSVISSLPLIISSLDISYVDCIFEMTSALTTTGATTIVDIKSLSEGLLLWRSLLQLLGGIGFIMSCLYVFSDFLNPTSLEYNNYSKNLALSQQLKIIICLYVIFTIISSFILIGSGVPTIDAINYSLSTISSGGMLTSEINGFIASPTIFWILSILMFTSGVSITFIKNLNSNGFYAFRDQQFICYISIIIICTAVFSIYMASFSNASVGESIKIAILTVTSSISTTGITVHFPESLSTFTNAFVYVLNFCGGCSGSCTGGIKIFRLIMAFLLVKSYLIRLVKTNIIYVPTYAGNKLDETYVAGLFSYFLCYLLFAIFMSLALSISDLNFSKAFSAIVTTINNNGPFFELQKATVTEISALSSFAKIILIISMVAGRVEFIPFFMILLKQFWKK